MLSLWSPQVQSLAGELKSLKLQGMDKKKNPNLYTVQMYEVNIFLFSSSFLYTHFTKL